VPVTVDDAAPVEITVFATATVQVT